MRDYKYKTCKEKDSQDKEKLTRSEKRAVEGSNRMAAKEEIRKELENFETKQEDDNYDELEMELSNLCYKAELVSKRIGDTDYKCTCPCPENEKLAMSHIDYLKEYIAKGEIKEFE